MFYPLDASARYWKRVRKMRTNIAASIRARLFNKAKENREEFEFTLVRYACERFLYRLGESHLRGSYILKGASLLSVWLKESYRVTRDVDLLAFGRRDFNTIRAAIESICRIPCSMDGLAFDLDSLRISQTRDALKYPGCRAKLHALLDSARIHLQVDFGFGDVLTAGTEEAKLPTLIDGLPVPNLRAYPRVTTIAEKFEAMVKLGRNNSRMKDFHDIWILSQNFVFQGNPLRKAILACFERRGTPWTDEIPEVLQLTFYSDDSLQTRWQSYCPQSNLLVQAPYVSFEVVGERICAFLGPVCKSILANTPFLMYWPSGGPWKMYTELDVLHTP